MRFGQRRLELKRAFCRRLCERVSLCRRNTSSQQAVGIRLAGVRQCERRLESFGLLEILERTLMPLRRLTFVPVETSLQVRFLCCRTDLSCRGGGRCEA